MTEAQKVQMVQQLITDVSVTTEMIQSYLALSADRILSYAYPFREQYAGWSMPWPSQYDLLQVQLAVRMIARKGGEGEVAHSENGVSRTYGSVDDEDLLKQIVPFVGVI